MFLRDRWLVHRPGTLTRGAMLALLALLGPCHPTASAQGDPAAPPAAGVETGGEYTATVVREPVQVDGVLEEEVWRTAGRIHLPYETFPGSNAPSPVETTCRLAYDARALYLGCLASDPAPDALRAYVTDRDELEGQDRIVLGLSPHADGRRAFLFQVNPLGVQGDAVYDEAQDTADLSWDAIWESAGRMTADGYVVEVAVPFRSLRFPERSGPQSWSFYLERFWPRQAEVRVQSFREDESEACRLCQVNRLTGLQVSSGGSVQITPTVSASRTDERPLGEAEWSGELSPEAGLDVTWSVSSDVTLNATVNPDFSQVEADVAQLEANVQYALFFPERRPFFQEGADLFSTPVTLAFTRTIVDPDVGGKTTGKVHGNAFGALVARDRVTSILVPGPFGSSSVLLKQESWTGMARYRRDLTRTATVGALMTVREGDGYYNRVAAADAFFRPLPALQVQLQAGYSATDYPDGLGGLDGQAFDPFAGSLVSARASFDNRTWIGMAGYQRQGHGFRADAGFLPLGETTQHWAYLSRGWFGTSASAISEARFGGGAWYDHATPSGELVSRGVWLTGRIRGPGQSTLAVNPNVFDQRLDGRTYERLVSVYIRASTRPSRWLSASIESVLGTTVDIANARRAVQRRARPEVVLRPGRQFEARLAYAVERLDTPQGERILDAAVAQARLVYNFSPRAFVRAVVQHRQTDRNRTTHVGPVTPLRESALSQLLFSYKVNPRTVLFLGYSDRRQGLTELDDTRTALTPTERTFFFKLGYAFQP